MTTVDGTIPKDDPLVAEAASMAYTPPLFNFHDLPFHDLPPTVQDFLTHTTNLYPDSPECSSLEYSVELTHIRENRAARFQRVLEGVNRDMANNMVVVANPTGHSDDYSRNIPIAEIRNILIPEWRSHLNDYVEEIDALVWFSMHTRKGTQYPFSLKRVLIDRDEYVAKEVELALRSLFVAHERQKREARGSALMAGIMDSMGDELDGELESIAQQDSASNSGSESPN